jgi:hypothetical protein
MNVDFIIAKWHNVRKKRQVPDKIYGRGKPLPICHIYD